SKLAVIETAHRNYFVDAVENIGQVSGICAGPCWIEFFLFSDKSLRDALTRACSMDPSLFISYRPHKYRSAASISFDQPFKLVHVLGTAVKQSLFIHDQHTEAVTGIEQFRCRWIVARAICVHAHVP